MSGTEPSPTVSKGLPLYTQILIGLVVGAVSAAGAKLLFAGSEAMITELWSVEALIDFGERWIEPLGKLFIRAIILTVVPLVFTSIAGGIYGLGDLRELGRMGGRTLVIFMSTAFLGACLATATYHLFDPAAALSPDVRAEIGAQMQAQYGGAVDGKRAAASGAESYFSGSLLQILVGLVPTNIAAAFADNRGLLRVILFALLFGSSMTLIPRAKAEPVAELLDGVNELMIKIIELIMKLAPAGVAALVFMVVARFGAEILVALAQYTLVVIVALVAHVVFVLLPVVRLLARRAPLPFLRAIKTVWITAFSTSSSSATLPTTMKVAEEELDVPRPISAFVLPLGATVNMDGTTIYQIIAVHFVAGLWGVTLEPATQIALIFSAMLMAIGAAGVPGGVIPLLFVVMATAGIPDVGITQGIALILGMDRILDMCRSSVNVVGDLATASVVARVSHIEGASESVPDPQS